MPNNRLGSEPDIDIPRAPISNDPDFGVQRMLDGHKYPGGGENEVDDELRNIHHP